MIATTDVLSYKVINIYLSSSIDHIHKMGKKGGAVCRKRLTFLYTSPYEHVEYNVSGP